MDPPRRAQHIVQDHVDEANVHVLQLSDEEGGVEEVPAPISPRTIIIDAFPRAELSTMVEGLSKPNWQVYPELMRKCLDSTLALCSLPRYVDGVEQQQ